MPFVQKGNPVTIPLGTTAPVISTGAVPTFSVTGGITNSPIQTNTINTAVNTQLGPGLAGGFMFFGGQTGLATDLTAVTVATINSLRLAFQTQKLLERDARGGTRYTEIIRAHFGVLSPDARLQRPEYLGGGHNLIVINPVAQTSATAVSGSDTPQGNLAAIGTGVHQCGFSQSFTEHGYIMCLINVRADLTYQQGQRRHWHRSTRYDYYFPVFAMLGEQSVLNKEIYIDGQGSDDLVFGYQERWAEYRYLPNEVTGLFRSTAAQTIDPWHYAEFFASRPALNDDFITDQSDSTVERSLAVGAAAGGQQFLFDAFYDVVAARPMPLYSVPGMVDHF